MHLSTLILPIYFGVLGLLALYGAHRAYLLLLLAIHRRTTASPSQLPDELPFLTVQIPLYNELHVARRVLLACAALDWPRDRFEIQVLDDSTDETASVVAAITARLVSSGIDVRHLRRADRRGFKAGALAAGLAAARGEIIAVFDADFEPAPDFARRLVPAFADPRIGMVQARWGHLNRGASLLTRAQSVLLDGHFAIEHAARHRAGRFFNFNGTAGIWRRRCIEDAGGWQHDTLTEDLDLSYRAQLRGWRFAFVEDAVAPAELPVEMGAFKSQQHRWAQGSIQTARKLLPSILRAPLPLAVKLESVVHLTANATYLLMIVLALLLGPAAWLRRGQGLPPLVFLDLPLLAISLASIATFYLVAERRATGRAGEGLRVLPMVLAVGVGLSVNNARAVVQGLFSRRAAEFRRTPKYGLAVVDDVALATRRYRAGRNADTWIELAAGVYLAAWTAIATTCGLWGAAPFLVLFAAGFLFTSGLTLRQERVRPTP
ncbi:MAG TPA: glycosyltransferase [Candidatus Polarisedimenticolaceae bacterium]|nr:glycosyltransferase [Candidatus Polarisedimenticolaceae bacterium]